MKKYLVIILLTLCSAALYSQNRDVVLADIEANTVMQLANGMRLQVVKTSEYQYYTYRLTADVSTVGEGKFTGIKSVVADLTGCDFLPNDLIVKKMVSHNHALDSLFEFMADVIYGSKYADFNEYKNARLDLLENGNVETMIQRFADIAVGESFVTSESLRSIDKGTVESFVKQCFSPEKCILTVVADADPQAVFESAQKYFTKATKTAPKYQPDNKNHESGDYIYSLDAIIPDALIAYSNYFPLQKSSKNYMLGNVAYELMFFDKKEDATHESSLKSDCYRYFSRIGVDDFGRFQTGFFAPRNPGFDFATAGAKAKDRVVEEFDKMLLRPEYAAEIASYLIIYKFPKNYFSLYKQQVQALTPADISDFFSLMIKNGRSVMVVAGNRRLLHCALFDAAKEREVDFVTYKLETKRVIPKGFSELTVIDNYLNKTGLKNPPKNLVEDFVSKYTFPNSGSYSCVGKIYRKYPNMYKMQNLVMHTPDSLILHYVEMYDGVEGCDSTKLYGCIKGDSLRNKQLAQKAAFPVEAYYNQLNISARLVCDYELDTAGYYKLDITDPLGGRYHDYFSIADYTKHKTDILSSTSGVDAQISYTYELYGQYWFPKTIVEKSYDVTIETTFREYSTSESLKKTDFQQYVPPVDKKKRH